MADKIVMQRTGDYSRALAFEGGNVYRHHHQDMAPMLEQIRELQTHQTKETNPSERTYIGSVPVVLLVDWLNKRGYTKDQYARNENGIATAFKKYFLSREFSKLHTQHTTTRRESNRIVVPTYIGKKHDNELRRVKGSGSGLD